MKLAIATSRARLLEALENVITGAGKHQLAGFAEHGESAVALCVDQRPDALLLDLELSGARAAEITRRVMAEAPCPVLLMTRGPNDRLSEVYEAMGAGALDVVPLPFDGVLQNAEQSLLAAKLGTIAKLLGRDAERGLEAPRFPKLLAIGASTGGPHALVQVLSALRDTRLAVVIVQHVDCEFAQGLASWLEEQSGLPTELATSASRPRSGHVLLAATNDHLKLTSGHSFAYTREPEHLSYRPSVNVLFDSLARNWPKPGIAVLLTGMGRDGAEGLLSLRQKRWFTIAQDEETSVVFGMPKAAIELGAAVSVLPIGEIGLAIAARA